MIECKCFSWKRYDSLYACLWWTLRSLWTNLSAGPTLQLDMTPCIPIFVATNDHVKVLNLHTNLHAWPISSTEIQMTIQRSSLGRLLPFLWNQVYKYDCLNLQLKTNMYNSSFLIMSRVTPSQVLNLFTDLAEPTRVQDPFLIPDC